MSTLLPRLRAVAFPCLTALLFGLVVAASAAAPAAPESSDWPQWRGPSRDGHSGVDLPDSWPSEPRRIWQVTVGTGHSSPVTQEGRVWQFSREADREILRAIRLADGTVEWAVGHEVPYTMHPAARGHGKGPKSTPVVADGRIFTLGIAGALTAHDAATGETLWRHDFTDRFPETSPDFGAAMSPLVLGDRVIAHVGGRQGGALAAFEAATGRRIWAYDGDGPAYASPRRFRFDGVDQVVTQTQSFVVAVDPTSGELLWRLPLRTDYDQNSVTPVADGPRLILSGLDRGLFAVRPRREAGGWTLDEAWRNDDVSLYMSSPVLVEGRLFGMSHRRSGQFFALDPEDGSVAWTSLGREGENAAVVAVDGRVLFLTDEARLVVVDVDSTAYDPAAIHTMADSATWAHPVPTPRGLLVKDVDALSLWRLSSP